MIETESKVRKVVSSAPLAQVDYYIDPSNIIHITSMLRNMYSNPVRACIREYCSNALDAHVLAGIPSRPIEITVPTALSPTFAVRDFGPGLNLKDTRLLFGFGSSGEYKRKSNEFIGGKGIGAKVGYAVASAFMYTIWNGGVKRIWSNYLNEFDASKTDLQTEEPSSEPSGIEVSIPVPEDSVNRFQQELAYAFRWWTVKPKFINHALPIQNAPESLVRGSLCLVSGDEKKDISFSILAETQERNAMPIVVMGAIEYPIDLHASTLSELVSRSYQSRALMHRLVIHAPIGLLQLAPSREALQYSASTRATLKKIFERLLDTNYLRSVMDASLREETSLRKACLCANVQHELCTDVSAFSQFCANFKSASHYADSTKAKRVQCMDSYGHTLEAVRVFTPEQDMNYTPYALGFLSGKTMSPLGKDLGIRGKSVISLHAARTSGYTETGYHNYWLVASDNETPSALPGARSMYLSGKNNCRCVLLVTPEQLDAIRVHIAGSDPWSRESVVTLVRRLVYSAHSSLSAAPDVQARLVGFTGSYEFYVFISKDADHMRKSPAWQVVLEGAMTEIGAETLLSDIPEPARTLLLSNVLSEQRPYRSSRRRYSRSSGSGIRTNYAAHSRKLVELVGDYHSVHNKMWKPLKVSDTDVDKVCVVNMDRFIAGTISAVNLDGSFNTDAVSFQCSSDREMDYLRNIVRIPKVHKELLGSRPVVGIRHSDYKALHKRYRFKTVWTALQEYYKAFLTSHQFTYDHLEAFVLLHSRVTCGSGLCSETATRLVAQILIEIAARGWTQHPFYAWAVKWAPILKSCLSVLKSKSDDSAAFCWFIEQSTDTWLATDLVGGKCGLPIVQCADDIKFWVRMQKVLNLPKRPSSINPLWVSDVKTLPALGSFLALLVSFYKAYPGASAFVAYDRGVYGNPIWPVINYAPHGNGMDCCANALTPLAINHIMQYIESCKPIE